MRSIGIARWLARWFRFRWIILVLTFWTYTCVMVIWVNALDWHSQFNRLGEMSMEISRQDSRLINLETFSKDSALALEELKVQIRKQAQGARELVEQHHH